MPENNYELLVNDCAVFPAPGSVLIALSGEDRKEWLQGQATNDIRPLELGGRVSFCFTEPTGQLIADCTVWSLPNRFLLSTAHECLDGVLKRVDQMVIMEDVEASHLTLGLVSIQGPLASAKIRELLPLPSLDGGVSRYHGTEAIALRNDRSGVGGWDLWLEPAAAVALRNQFEAVSEGVAEIARVEAGIPVFGREMTHKTLPPELGEHFVSSHISYTKGCYTGQEVLMRIFSRGHTNRSMVGLHAKGPITVGDIVHHEAREDAGVVTSSCISPVYGNIALAMVRKEALDGSVSVGTQSAEIRALPSRRVG